jgi:hypothetical protein
MMGADILEALDERSSPIKHFIPEGLVSGLYPIWKRCPNTIMQVRAMELLKKQPRRRGVSEGPSTDYFVE